MKGNCHCFSPSVSEDRFRLPSATSKISAVILENVFPVFFLFFFLQPRKHNKLICLQAESYQSPAFHWLPAWPDWCLTVSVVVWRKSLCCINPHRVTGGATHLRARIYTRLTSPQKIIRPQLKQMATVKCPVGEEKPPASRSGPRPSRESLCSKVFNKPFVPASALGNQIGIICELTADSPRLHKYLRNNPQPIRRGQTHSCNICGFNALSVGKKNPPQ